MKSRVLVLLALIAGWATVSVVGATPAFAHATVVSSDPADSSRLQAAPARVSVTFSEDVSVAAGFLKVVDSKGEEVSSGTAAADGATISIQLRSGTGDGSYIVSYRVGSDDSHPISGAFAFVVGDGPLVVASGAVVGGSTDRLVNAVFVAVRWTSFAGVVLLGGLAFVVLCWPAGRTDPRARRLIRTGWAATAGSALAGLLLQGPYVAGSGLTAVLDLDLLQATLGTTYGRMLCARLVLLGVLGVLAGRILRADDLAPDRSRARDEDLAAICGLGVLATYGGVGHAAASRTPTLALMSDTTHLAAASLWIGGLVLLVSCLLPPGRTAQLAEVLPRFSRLALGSVAALVVTGTYQAWREVWPVPALWSTGYGRLLIAKVAGFLLLVGLAYLSRRAVNRRYVRPLVHAFSAEAEVTEHPAGRSPAEDRAVRRLRAWVGVEALLGAGVLVLSALLVSTAPARATYSRPVEQSVVLASGGTATIQLAPAKVGVNTLRVTVFDAQGRRVDAQQVTATATLPSAQIGPLPVNLTRAGTGEYVAAAASLPRPGTWELVVRVQKSAFDRDVTQVDVTVN